MSAGVFHDNEGVLLVTLIVTVVSVGRKVLIVRRKVADNS